MAQAAPSSKLVLKQGVIHGFLENFNRSPDNECLQFIDINCAAQELEQLGKAADEIKEVVNIDFSNNSLADISPLKDLSRIVRLNVANNRIKNMAIFATDEVFQNLKWLDISNNKFNAFPAFKCPKLEYLNISGNKLEKIDEGWTGHDKLRVVVAVDNKFKSLVPFKAMPKLEELYMAQNQLTSLSGWEALPALKKLHLRRNKISKIDEEGLPELPELQYINLRHNALESLDVVFNLFQFPNIKDINILNNPVELSTSSFNILMAEFLIKKPSLDRVCKRKVTEASKMEAVHLAHYRFDKSEEERKAKLAEEAAAAELEN